MEKKNIVIIIVGLIVLAIGVYFRNVIISSSAIFLWILLYGIPLLNSYLDLSTHIGNYFPGIPLGFSNDGSEYKFLRYDKHICIFNNNHGMFELRPRLKVQKNSFNKIRHGFSLNDCGLIDSTITDLSTLQGRAKDNIRSRFNEQTFCSRLISINSKDVDHGDSFLNITDDVNESGPKSRGFFITFDTGKFKKGDVIEYAWGYSFPNLFPVKKEEMKQYNLIYPDYCAERIKLFHNIDELNIKISFEEGIQLLKPPELWEEDIITGKTQFLQDLKKEEDLYYTRYKTRTRGKANHRYIIKWKYP